MVAASQFNAAAAVLQAATCYSSNSTIVLQPSAFQAGPADSHLNILPTRSCDPVRLILNRVSTDSSAPAILCAPADPVVISRLASHLPALVNRPVVLNIATTADHSPVTSVLRTSGVILLFSGSASQAQTNTIIAIKIAKHAGRAVLHWFEAEDQSSCISWNKTQLTAAKKYINDSIKPQANGVNGHINGSTESQKQKPASEEVEDIIIQAFDTIPRSLGSASAQSYRGTASPSSIIVALGSEPTLEEVGRHLPPDTGLLSLSLFQPLTPHRLLSIIPESVKNVLVLEQSYSKITSLGGPLLMEVASIFNEADERSLPQITGCRLGKIGTVNANTVDRQIKEAISPIASFEGHSIGDLVPSPAYPTDVHIPKHEQSYNKILETLFGSSLEIVNAPDASVDSSSTAIPSTLPAYALGKVLARRTQRSKLVHAVQAILADAEVPENELTQELRKWIESPTNDSVAFSIVGMLESSDKPTSGPLELIYELRSNFIRKSSWIVGSDAWSYDLGTSGVHHTLSSGANVNLLIIDSQPYDGPEAVADPERRIKKDIGLYAMNYGNAYVASVAVYGDYSQVVRAFQEADSFDGPSIILAYLPDGNRDSTRALDVLKETKKAIDSGFWPLYRWNPSKEVHRVPQEDLKAGGRGWNPLDEKDAFQLDSEHIKNDMKAFLDRQNHLTLLAKTEPVLADSITDSLGKRIEDATKAAARAAFEKLSGVIDGPSLLVLYASDGGNAEKVAKRFTARARARGIGARADIMDNVDPTDLSLEPFVVLITSTAGQGEFPNNGRFFWKSLAANTSALGPTGGEGKNLDQVKYSVFGMGDSHYWPRPEDAHYYNKSSKDLDNKLSYLGAQRFADLGLGDDQDADGYQTGYKIWEASVWKALNVAEVEVVEAEPEPITNEHIKIASNYLRGTIAEGLKDKSTGALAESDGQLTKFHGIYQQDDRDIREQRKEQGLEPAYSFMVRVRLPAGVCKPDQWLAIDEISDRLGNHTFKMTTRQTFQFHGIVKSNLKPAIQEINKALLDTIAACGDVNRNVMCSSYPSIGPLHAQVHDFAKNLSEHLMPSTSAYAEIWLDKKMVAGDAMKNFTEPLYGPYYLPRKFKIAIAIPPRNDTDVFCNDVGFIAIKDPDTGNLLGFNVSIGGGMGVTHAMKTTYPRVGSIIGFATAEQCVDIAEKIMLVQRDNGNRANRKNARLKYTIDRMGLANYVAEVEKRLGYSLQPARSYEFLTNIDEFGWEQGSDGNWHCTVFIENGRVEDASGKPQKAGLREIAKVHKGVFRLTGNQHVTIADVTPEAKPEIERLMKEHHLDQFSHSGLRLSSSACVAFPTCGLAMAESERFLPHLIDRVERITEEAGLKHDSIVMRVTGCPNGCARPYVAEIAFVGKAPNSYLMLLGGGYYGQRLNKIYREAVSEEEIVEILNPMIKSYAKNRLDGEKFGDFTIRMGWIAETTDGHAWYDKMTEGKAVEAA